MVSRRHEHGSRRPILEVVFFRTEAGNEPVREWLRALVREDRRTIGEDIKTAQCGWPIGMPLIRKLATDLWEVRSRVDTGIARVIFTVDGQTMVLLHGFGKKVPAHTASGSHDGKAETRSTTIGVTHEEKARRKRFR
jgi:phage-related protein